MWSLCVPKSYDLFLFDLDTNKSTNISNKQVKQAKFIFYIWLVANRIWLALMGELKNRLRIYMM